MATLTLTVVGLGSVTIGANTYTAGTTQIPGLSGSVNVTATPNVNCKFVRWAGANTSITTSISITMDVNKSLTANFLDAPIVTRRKYWPSQTELANDRKSCGCNCFKPKANYTSFAERDRALRFAAAGCNCCTAAPS